MFTPAWITSGRALEPRNETQKPSTEVLQLCVIGWTYRTRPIWLSLWVTKKTRSFWSRWTSFFSCTKAIRPLLHQNLTSRTAKLAWLLRLWETRKFTWRNGNFEIVTESWNVFMAGEYQDEVCIPVCGTTLPSRDSGIIVDFRRYFQRVYGSPPSTVPQKKVSMPDMWSEGSVCGEESRNLGLIWKQKFSATLWRWVYPLTFKIKMEVYGGKIYGNRFRWNFYIYNPLESTRKQTNPPSKFGVLFVKLSKMAPNRLTRLSTGEPFSEPPERSEGRWLPREVILQTEPSESITRRECFPKIPDSDPTSFSFSRHEHETLFLRYCRRAAIDT